MNVAPSGKVVKTVDNIKDINIPEYFRQLEREVFTGFLKFRFEVGTGLVLYNQGRMTGIFFFHEQESFSGLQALSIIFAQTKGKTGSLQIHQISVPLVRLLHDLFHGVALFRSQSLLLMDVPYLLRHVVESALTGALRVRCGEDAVLIFYKEGKPVGFFLNGQTDLVRDVNVAESLALKEGAVVDIFQSRAGAEQFDFLHSVDMDDLWKRNH